MTDQLLADMVRAVKITPYWQLVAAVKARADEYLNNPCDKTKAEMYYACLMENIHHQVQRKPLDVAIEDMQHYLALTNRIKHAKN